jgi:hypothetical protein
MEDVWPLVEYFRDENAYEGNRADLDRLTTVQAALRLLRERADERAAAEARDEFSSSWFTHLAAVTKRAEAAEAAQVELRAQLRRTDDRITTCQWVSFHKGHSLSPNADDVCGAESFRHDIGHAHRFSLTPVCDTADCTWHQPSYERLAALAPKPSDQ